MSDPTPRPVPSGFDLYADAQYRPEAGEVVEHWLVRSRREAAEARAWVAARDARRAARSAR